VLQLLFNDKEGITMSLSRLVLFAVCTLSSSAWADTVPDPKVWAQRFAAIASHGDKDTLFAAFSPVFDPRANRAQLKSGLETMERGLEGRRAKSSSIIREELLGDAVYRFNMAVHYGGTYYLFYSVELLHIDDGWEVVNFNVSTDLNKVLNLPWPFK
jgi:hypothetical protein